MRKFFFILLCFISLDCLSQNGYLKLKQDDRMELLIQRQKEIHSADNTIDGFRIQIFMESGNDAVEHANIMMEEFKLKYPDVPVYLVFGQPYYRLRVGDYRTRLEAEKAFQIISSEYKNAFITGDRIQLPYNVFCDSEYEFQEDVKTRASDMDNIYYDDYEY